MSLITKERAAREPLEIGFVRPLKHVENNQNLQKNTRKIPKLALFLNHSLTRTGHPIVIVCAQMPNQHFDLVAAARREMIQDGFEPDFPPETAVQLATIQAAGPPHTEAGVRD